jgi:hypothetical protein
MHQPAGGTSTITFGEHLSAEEAEALLKRRPGSDLKNREILQQQWTELVFVATSQLVE